MVIYMWTKNLKIYGPDLPQIIAIDFSPKNNNKKKNNKSSPSAGENSSALLL